MPHPKSDQEITLINRRRSIRSHLSRIYRKDFKHTTKFYELKHWEDKIKKLNNKLQLLDEQYLNLINEIESNDINRYQTKTQEVLGKIEAQLQVNYMLFGNPYEDPSNGHLCASLDLNDEVEIPGPSNSTQNNTPKTENPIQKFDTEDLNTPEIPIELSIPEHSKFQSVVFSSPKIEFSTPIIAPNSENTIETQATPIVQLADTFPYIPIVSIEESTPVNIYIPPEN